MRFNKNREEIHMKKIISVLLAAMMIVGIVSAGTFSVFAADNNLRLIYGPQWGPGYSFSRNGSGTTGVLNNVTYADTNGFWRVAGATNILQPISSFYDGMKIKFGKVGDYAAFGINVPAAGTYDVSLGVTTNASNYGVGAVYILPGNTSDIESAIADNSEADFYINFQDTSKKSYTESAKEFAAAGEYLVIYKLAELGSGSNNSMIVPGILELKSGDGSAGVPMLHDGNVIAPASVAKGSSVQITHGDVYLSNDIKEKASSNFNNVSKITPAEGVTYTYESLTPSVASVDENGNIEGLATGTAKINVTADYAGVKASKVVSIDVVNPNLSGIKVKYDFVMNRETGKKFAWNVPEGYIGNIGYAQTGGMWAYKDISKAIAARATNGDIKVNEGYGIHFQSGGTTWLALSVNVPVSGEYNVSIGYAKNTAGAAGEVYLVPASETSTNADIGKAIAGREPIVSFDCYSADVTKLTAGFSETANDLELLAGEYTVIYNCTHKTAGTTWALFLTDIVLNGGETLAPMITASASDSLKVGETADVTASANYLSDGSAISGANISVVSLNDCASVSGTTVTAEKAGTAKIKVTAVYNGITSEKTLGIEITENKDAEAPSSVTLGLMAENVGENDITFGAYSKINSLSLGDEVSVSAPDVSGYSFKYWRTNGGYASSEKDYSFRIYGNTVLCAVYEKDSDENGITVEFLNGNGAFVERRIVAAGTLFSEMTKPSVSLTGFNFLEWAIAGGNDVISKNTTAVAQYEASDISESVSINGASKTYSYDETVNASDDSAKYWTRDGAVVAYGTSYTFHAWSGSSEILSHSDDIEVKPTVVLDSDTINGAYMMEYDVPEGFTKLEAGIIFGNGATVGSYQSKAVSKSAQSVRHGQFTASPKTAGDTATGYVIYSDGADIRVAYSK